ncbi:LysR family transcriptional regulator [soil metagenome]
MNVTLRQLRVFLAVAETRNFSQAGSQIALTQPAVSRSITELEGQLGVRLLDRTTREVTLTLAGQALAPRLSLLMDELEHALLDVHDMAVTRRGKVRIASSPTLSAGLMPACIAECTRREPNVELMLLDRIQESVLESVRSGEVDFGVAVEPSSTTDLHCETILRDPFCLVALPTHRLAQAKSVRWTSLEGERLVLLDHSSGSRRLIDAALQKRGTQCEVVQQVGHPTTAFRMVEAGIGISIMPRLAVPPGGLDGLVSLTLSPRAERSIMLVRRRARSPTPLADMVWALIRETVASSGPTAS